MGKTFPLQAPGNSTMAGASGSWVGLESAAGLASGVRAIVSALISGPPESAGLASGGTAVEVAIPVLLAVTTPVDASSLVGVVLVVFDDVAVAVEVDSIVVPPPSIGRGWRSLRL